ncbi:MAG: response regulator [Spirochaetia bacterium]|nr:response regulator [Spirochaetia bacterium]
MKSSNKNIILIDDEKVIVNLLEMILKKYNFSVKSFSDPGMALDFVQEKNEKFDLVITDLSMPGMSGLELAKKINLVNQSIPIIMLSGNMENISEKPDYIKSYISKPVTVQELIKEINKVFLSD